MADFAIRPYRHTDAPFVYKAWLRGYWEHFPGRVIVTEREFMERWHRVIERILADERTRTVVAHVEGEPDSLLGFACGNEDCLHWAYVKQAFRGMGVASACMDAIEAGFDGAVPCKLSHWPGKLQDVWAYAPELLREYGA